MMPLRLARNTQRAIRVCFAFILAVVLTAAAAQAEEQKTLKGVALVIGQSKYAHIAPLANPTNDARDMSKLLTDLGFDGRAVTDRDAGKLSRDLERFVEDAEGADIAFLYYSGHGIEAGGENYLVPVDADEASLGNASETLVSLTQVVDRLKTLVPVVIVLVDACRTNPFPSSAQLKATPESPARPITLSGLGAPRGAAVIEEAAPAIMDNLGIVIGFAAEPGKVALDGQAGSNSPYAAALLRHFSANTGFDFGQVMTMVTEEVYLATEARQRPWTNASLRRILSFGGKIEAASPDETLLDGERRKLLLTIAATPQEWRNTIETLAREQSLPLDPLYGMLKELQVDTRLGSAGLEEQLRQGAENLQKILAESAPLRKDPELNRLAGLADRAQAQGAIALARKYRAEASARADELGKKLEQREAEILADRIELTTIFADEGATAMLAGRAEEAAAKYQKAYQQLQGEHDKLGFKYKLGEATAYLARGRHPLIRDRAATRKAANAFREAVAIADRMGDRDAWATAQSGLAYALALPSGGPIDPAEANRAYEAALTIWTPERNLREWSKAQYGRAGALKRLGEGELREDCLKDHVEEQCHGRISKIEAAGLLSEAVTAYETLLRVVTPDTEAFDWSFAQYNLGDALMRLGVLDAKPARLAKAADAYRAALTRKALDERAGVKSAIQIRLGRALMALGEAENDHTYFNESVLVFEGAISTREKAGMPTSSILDDVGWAKLLIGKHTGSRATIAAGRQLVEASWKGYKSFGLAEKDAYYQGRLKQFDEALRALEP